MFHCPYCGLKDNISVDGENPCTICVFQDRVNQLSRSKVYRPMTRKYWTTLEGKQIEISAMDLGHLANSIRMLGEALEKAKAAGNDRDAARHEANLTALQDELATRGTQIDQAQGIARALFKSVGK